MEVNPKSLWRQKDVRCVCMCVFTEIQSFRLWIQQADGLENKWQKQQLSSKLTDTGLRNKITFQNYKIFSQWNEDLCRMFYSRSFLCHVLESNAIFFTDHSISEIYSNWESWEMTISQSVYKKNVLHKTNISQCWSDSSFSSTHK